VFSAARDLARLKEQNPENNQTEQQKNFPSGIICAAVPDDFD
jgi:hypothetical protein